MRRNTLVAVFIIAVFVTIATLSIAQQFRQPGYLDYVEEQAKAEAIRHKYEVDKQMYSVIVVTGYVVVLSLCVIGLSYVAGLAYLHVKRMSHAVKPDRNGLLPVARDDTETARLAILAYHLARIADASRQPVPHHVNYSPKLDIDVSHAAAHHDTMPHTLPGDASHHVEPVTFRDLLRDNRIGKGQPLYLGYDLTDGRGIWGTWRELYSAGLGGVQGSGKTWTAASLIAQSLLNNARVILCDPHAGDDESLTTRLEPLTGSVELVVEKPADILQAAQYAYEELERRKTRARQRLQYDTRQLILVLDEWTTLLRGELHDALPQLIQAITTEGRKFGVQALLIAQRWSAAASGGSDVRNTLTAHYIHRMRADEARMMTGLCGSVLPKDTLALHPGQAYLLNTRGEIRKIATPYMTSDDLHHVAELLQPDPVREVVGEVGSEAASEVVPTAPLPPHQKAEKWTAEELRILTALKAGKTPGEVAREVAGCAGGKNYQAAARLVADVIQRVLALIE